MAKKRRVYRIEFKKSRGVWVCSNSLVTDPKKSVVVAAIRGKCREDWNEMGQETKMIVHGKDGKIQYESTYPRSSDPVRYKS